MEVGPGELIVYGSERGRLVDFDLRAMNGDASSGVCIPGVKCIGASAASGLLE